jgi:hypothetical protein
MTGATRTALVAVAAVAVAMLALLILDAAGAGCCARKGNPTSCVPCR